MRILEFGMRIEEKKLNYRKCKNLLYNLGNARRTADLAVR